MVKTLERNDRTTGTVDRRIRIQIDAPASGQRHVVSAWKEEARALLAPRPTAEQPPSAPDMEIASALRQPSLWDVCNEPRTATVDLADEPFEASGALTGQPVSPWLRWEIIIPFALGLAAILQLIRAMG